jgi:hypothetical protein
MQLQLQLSTSAVWDAIAAAAAATENAWRTACSNKFVHSRWYVRNTWSGQMTNSILIQLGVEEDSSTHGVPRTKSSPTTRGKQIGKKGDTTAEYNDIFTTRTCNTNTLAPLHIERHRIVQPIQPPQHCLDKMRHAARLNLTHRRILPSLH